MIESKLLTAVHDYAIRLDKARYRQHRRRDFLEVDGSAFPEWKALAQTIGPDPTPRAAVEFYASVIIPRVRPSVKDNRVRNLLFRFCESLGSATELSAITQVHVSNFRSELIAREFANSSINRYMDDVYAFLRCCRDNGLLKFKYRRLRPFPTERRLIYLSPSELHRLLEASPVHLRQFLIFLLGTGARRAEAVNLTWDDVTFAPRPTKRSWVTFQKTKNGRPHSVPLPDHVTRMLKEMKAALPKGFKHVFSYKPKRDVRNEAGVLVLTHGVSKHLAYPNRDFQAVRQRAALLHINLHSCRHTYATRLVTAGVPLLTVSMLLNHKNVQSSATYVHLSPSHLEHSIEVLDRLSPSKPLGDIRSLYARHSQAFSECFIDLGVRRASVSEGVVRKELVLPKGTVLSVAGVLFLASAT